MPDENQLTSKSPLSDWLDAVARAQPGPGGGSGAAVGAAFAAALAQMAAGITMRKDRYAAGHDRAASVLNRAGTLRQDMLRLVIRDAEALRAFSAALAMSKTEEPARSAAKARAMHDAAKAQLDLLRGAAAAADLAVTIADVGATSTLGDAATGVFLATAAAKGAYWAMRADLEAGSAETASMLSTGLELLERTEAAEWRVRQILNERIR